VITEHVLQRLSCSNPELAINDSPVGHLAERPWLGNVRELRNAIEHAAVIARGRPLDIADFPAPETIGLASDRVSLKSEIERWTWQVLQSEPGQALATNEGDDSASNCLYEEFLAATEPALIRTILNATGGNRGAAAQ
jgi:two-component system nitrogen regulation response regulator GlnG